MKYSEMYNSLDPTKRYSASNFFFPNQYLGAPTSPMTPNQIQQLAQLVPTGMKNVEIGVLKPDEFEAIPKQHFEEMKQFAKLAIGDFEKAGKPSPLSMHAPQIDPTGFAENKWNEDHWKRNQEQLKDVIGKAFDLGTSTPVTIHGSEQISNIYRINPKTREEELDVMAVVDPESGQVQIAKREDVHYPHETVTETPEDRLRMMNNTFWENQRRELAAIDSERDRTAHRIEQVTQKSMTDIAKMSKTDRENLASQHPEVESLIRNYNVFTNNLSTHVTSAFDKAYKAAEQTQNEELKSMFKEVQQAGKRSADIAMNIISDSHFNPDVFVPVEDFARNKASETFAELALESVRLAKEKKIDPMKAPMICIENFHPELAFGRGKSMKALIEESRRKFVEKASDRGINASEAKKLAEKLIGATWDVGHINLLGRYGYSKEELKSKHMKELKEVQEYIKHVHIHDNFGYNDAHLPPGMGNVPIKEVLKELEKAGKFGEMRAIVEAGGYVQHFKQVPTMALMQEMNSPLYSAQASPTWGERNYFFGSAGYGSGAGYGNFLPPEHYSMYGSGFSQLPTALGGVKGGGEKSKFSETPMS